MGVVVRQEHSGSLPHCLFTVTRTHARTQTTEADVSPPTICLLPLILSKTLPTVAVIARLSIPVNVFHVCDISAHTSSHASTHSSTRRAYYPARNSVSIHMLLVEITLFVNASPDRLRRHLFRFRDPIRLNIGFRCSRNIIFINGAGESAHWFTLIDRPC